MKRISAILVISLLFTMLVAGCSPEEHETDAEGQQIGRINISYVKLPLNVPSIIEKKNELFEKEFGKDNIKTVFPEITQGSKMTEALAAGSLDFCNALGGTSAILAAANGVNLKIIGIYSRAPKAFTIMAKDETISSPKDLKGKKIVGPKGTILHQLLLGALDREGLTVEDVSFINMGIPEGVAALMAGSADVALVAGASVTEAAENGARIIATGEELLDATIVIAVSGEFLDKHPDIVERYMKVHAESLRFMEDYPKETFEIVAEETGIPIEEVKTMYEWYDFSPGITEEDIVELEKTQEFLQLNGMLPDTIDIRSIIQDI